MSETVHYIGKLILVEQLGGESLEEQCKRILGSERQELPSWCENYKEFFRQELYEEYVIYNDRIYQVIYEDTDPYEDIFHAQQNQDGSIGFVVQYYNGGCSFDEAIENALKKMA